MDFGKLSNRKFVPPRPNRGGAWNPNKTPERTLTGKVQDTKAAAGEERLSRTFNKAIGKGILREYKFRWTTIKRNTINFRELDFLVFKTSGEVVAISVKNKAFTHFGTKIKERDKMSEIIILSRLKDLGIPVRDIKTVWDVDLKDQETADKTAKRLRLYK